MRALADVRAEAAFYGEVTFAPIARSWPKRHCELLYGLPGRLVTVVDAHTEADPVALVADFLTAFGNAVGADPHIIADSARHPARLNMLLVGDTSRARKGTSRAVVERVMRLADPSWANDHVYSGLSSGEGLIAALSRLEDRRLLVVEPEFARVLKVAGRDGSTLSPIIRHAWDSGDLQVLTRKDPLRVEGAHVSIIAHVTAEELRARLTGIDIANGFGNRFLLMAVKRSKMLPSGGNLEAGALQGLGREVAQMLGKARQGGEMRRSDAAERRWHELYEQIWLAEDPGGLCGALTARASAQLLRLSLAYALTDGATTIDACHLEAAWALWQYASDSVDAIFGGPLNNTTALKLLDALRAVYPDGLDGRAQANLLSRHTANLAPARQLLVDEGFAEIVEDRGTGGRPRQTLVAVPGEQSGQSEQMP